MTRKLTQWMQAQNQATRVHDRRRLNELAQEFTDLVVEQLAIAREQHYGQPTVTRQLTLLRIDQQPLPDEYLVSMIRNWTVGELEIGRASCRERGEISGVAVASDDNT